MGLYIWLHRQQPSYKRHAGPKEEFHSTVVAPREHFMVQLWHLQSVTCYSGGVTQERHTALSLTVIDKMDRLGEVIPIDIEAASPIDWT